MRRNRIIRSKGENSSDKISSSNAINRRLSNQEKYSGNTNLASASSTSSTSTLCPICNQTITGNNMEVNDHVNNCLGHSTVNSEDSSGQQGDKFVAYDWCGKSSEHYDHL